jgi:S1-C subfamily serine protease
MLFINQLRVVGCSVESSAPFVSVRTIGAVVLSALLIGLNSGRAAEPIARGSGIVIGSHGEILTNAHVVRDCARITVRSSSSDSFAAQLIASDDKNDLAVVSGLPSLSSVAVFRDLPPVRAGEAVVAMGYPLSGLLAATANLSLGNVSALAGCATTRVIFRSALPSNPETAADRCSTQAVI